MTYVLIEHGRVVRPADRDEATQWQWERVLEHRRRGHYRCRYVAWNAECLNADARCCEGGRLVVRKGWRRWPR